MSLHAAYSSIDWRDAAMLLGVFLLLASLTPIIAATDFWLRKHNTPAGRRMFRNISWPTLVMGFVGTVYSFRSLSYALTEGERFASASVGLSSILLMFVGVVGLFTLLDIQAPASEENSRSVNTNN